jgi:hypothetical protein
MLDPIIKTIEVPWRFRPMCRIHQAQGDSRSFHTGHVFAAYSLV